MYIRIEYVKRFGGCDSYVLKYSVEYGEGSMEAIMESLYTYGFTRTNTEKTNYDPELRIAPGAILAVVLCDERGYSKHDRERIRLEEEVRRRG